MHGFITVQKLICAGGKEYSALCSVSRNYNVNKNYSNTLRQHMQDSSFLNWLYSLLEKIVFPQNPVVFFNNKHKMRP